MAERTIDLYLKSSADKSQMEPAPTEKETKKKGKKKKGETAKEAKDGGAFDRKGSTGSLDGETTGNISCIEVREMKRKNPQASAIQIMNQINKMNNTGVPEQEVPVMEDYHEVFLGYESGAIGLVRISLSPDDTAPKIEHLIMILPRKIVSDFGAKHILALHCIDTSNAKHADPLNEFRLVVG